jgi:hypothetical protein
LALFRNNFSAAAYACNGLESEKRRYEQRWFYTSLLKDKHII